MKIFEINYIEDTLFINDDLVIEQHTKLDEIVATWSSIEGKHWNCNNKNKSKYSISQLFEDTQEYLPTKIIFFLTSSCNLNCNYCYSKMQPISYKLSFKDCTAVIDKMVKILKRLKRKSLKIKFHGGGEPFVAFDLMQQVVDYAKIKSKQESLKLKIDISTNGVLTIKQRDWIVRNVTRLNISFDGTEALHRKNRPAKNANIDSFLELKKTVKYFDSISYPFTLRTTITNSKSNNIRNVVIESKKLSKNAQKKLELVCENFPNNSDQLQFGKSINYLEYLNEYFFNKSEIDGKIKSFDAGDAGYGQCGAWGDNLILDGSNNISTCFKYSALGKSSPFYVSSLTDFLKKTTILEAENKIIGITKKANSECAYCFLWKKCGGGCLALRDKQHSNISCNLMRTFFIQKIINEVQNR